MPSKITKAQSRREEIIEVASRLFYEQGFGTTGIKQIIDEVGVAKGTFYTHFESKEVLGLEWLRARHLQWGSWFNEALEREDTPAGKLLVTYTFLEDWLSKSKFRGCAFINTMAETPDFNHPMRKEVAAHKQQLHEQYQNLAAAHFMPLGHTDEAARQKGTTLFLLFEGALVEAQNFNATWPIESAHAFASQMLSAS